MEEYMGVIKLFALNYVPRGYIACEGQSLQVSQNPALYSLLGTYFGGDGQTTFCLPNLKGKEPIPNTKYCICIEGIYPPRN